MANWVRIELYQTVNGVRADTTFDYRTSSTPTVSAMLNLLGEWDDVQLPAINAIQHESVINVGAKAQWRGNAAVSYETGLGGGGTYAPGPALIPQSQMAFYFRRYVSESKRWTDDTVEDVRPIARGAMLLCGITDDWMTNGNPEVPSALSTEYDDFRAAMIADVVVGGSTTYTPVVHGYALPAEGGEHPKEARDEVYADLEMVSFLRASWVRNRTPF